MRVETVARQKARTAYAEGDLYRAIFASDKEQIEICTERYNHAKRKLAAYQHILYFRQALSYYGVPKEEQVVSENCDRPIQTAPFLYNAI